MCKAPLLVALNYDRVRTADCPLVLSSGEAALKTQRPNSSKRLPHKACAGNGVGSEKKTAVRGTSLPPAGQEEVRSCLWQKSQVGGEKTCSPAAFTLCPATSLPISKIRKSCSSSLRSSCPRAPNAGSGDQIAVKDPNTSCSLPPAPRYNHTFSLRGPPSRPGAGPSSAGAAGAHLGPAVERTLALPPQLQGSAGRVRPRRIGARRGPLAPRHRLGTAARGPV